MLRHEITRKEGSLFVADARGGQTRTGKKDKCFESTVRKYYI